VEDVSAAELEAAVGYMLARAGEKVASQRVSKSAS
jgi:hypothetical protein